MIYESPLAPSEVIKKAEKYFSNEVLNSTIKEKPLSKKDEQKLLVGVTGGRWDIFQMEISAYMDERGIIHINSKGRCGLQQLFFAFLIWLLSTPFLFMAVSNTRYWLIIFAGFLFLVGVLSLIMPIVRIRETQKGLKEILTSQREVKEKF